MGIVDKLIKRFLHQGVIVSKAKISASAYHIQISSESIKSVEFIPGHFLRLGVGIDNKDTSIKDKVRSYSVWNIDKNNGTMDLAIATHSNGIGAKWVESCTIGMRVPFTWKTGKFIQDNSCDSYLMIGDLSALSHLYIINRHLPKEKQVESILYNESIEELYEDIDGTTPFSFYQMASNPVDNIKQKIAGILPSMQGTKMIYIAGDSRLCIALNNHLRNELNWNTKQLKIKPFWNPAKKGLE